MFKGKNYFHPNAIVGSDLKILDSNSFFKDFFKNEEDWKKLSVKITDLIEFDNLNEFKKSLSSIHSLEKTSSSFNGKIKIGEKLEPIKVTISHLQNADEKWSNQAVELTCQKVENDFTDSKFTKQVLENSPLKIFTIDREYTLTFFSKSSEVLLEFLLGEKPTAGQSFFTQGIDKQEWKNYFDIIFSDEKLILEKEYTTIAKEFYDLLTFSPIKNKNGFIEGCVIYANDILHLKKVELLHYQNHKKYQHLFENNFLGIGVLNENCQLIKANDSFCRLAGIENIIFNKVSADDFIVGEDFQLFERNFKQICQNEISNCTSKLRFKNADNEIKYVKVVLNGMFENNKFSGCLFSVLDISMIKEIRIKEQELNELKIKESINLKHQLLLQQELDSRIRELTSNQMLIAQKNNLISELCKKLEKLVRKPEHQVRPEIRKIISSINHQNVFDDDWENLKIHFVKMHPSFFETLTARSPKITEKDLRHCAYVKLGFSAKETSDLLGTLPRSIEQARFRIKKKLNLPNGQKLKEYLRDI